MTSCGSAQSSFLIINNPIGLGVGPILMGGLSDHLQRDHGVKSVRYAAVRCPGCYVLASVPVTSLRRDWVEEAA